MNEVSNAVILSQVLIALIAAAPPTIASIAALIITRRSVSKVENVEKKMEEVHETTKNLEHSTNSIKYEICATARREGYAEGVEYEKTRNSSHEDKVKSPIKGKP